MTATLFDRTLAAQDPRDANAVAAVESRRTEINRFEQLAAALNSRGMEAHPLVRVERIGAGAWCRFVLHLYCSADTFMDARDLLGLVGVGIERLADRGASWSRYQLVLADIYVELLVHVHRTPYSITPYPSEQEAA